MDERHGKPFCYVAGSEAEPEGYLIYRQKAGKDGYDLLVRDLVALTPAALERIWTFLADHRSLSGDGSRAAHSPWTNRVEPRTRNAIVSRTGSASGPKRESSCVLA